jgi:gamma-glutamyltranspeptidase/glutathione hydrolase
MEFIVPGLIMMSVITNSYGNVVSMTSTVESSMGSFHMVGGFLLTNQLTDFSAQPADGAGVPIANRVEPGKRPRSSMSPTLVFDKATGQLVISGGSPGGALIIHFTAKTLYGMLHWGLNAQQAIDLPNFGSLNGPTLLEAGRFSPAVVQALKSRGHTVVEVPMASGLQAIAQLRTHRIPPRRFFRSGGDGLPHGGAPGTCRPQRHGL